MKPSSVRSGGAGETIWYAIGTCSLGRLLVAATDRGVCSIFPGEDEGELVESLRQRFPRAVVEPGDERLSGWVHEAIRLVDDPASPPRLPLDLRGTAFQIRIWQALQTIRAGQTITYQELAARAGCPGSVRAAASACAANPLAVAVPCHRVVARDGNLAGYRWGLARKKELLDKEKR
jgi:AraC family transcriptional regulator of adaptative response/methylated-DNA-[protein]-cysteine methyltransferase